MPEGRPSRAARVAVRLGSSESPVPGIHTEPLERRSDVWAESVVADLRYDGGGVAEPGGGDGHVRSAPPEGFGEGLDLCERRPDLLGIEIHAHPSHRDDLGIHDSRTPFK